MSSATQAPSPDGDGDNPLFLAAPDRDTDAAAGFSIQWPEVNPHSAMQAPHFTGVTQFGSADTDSQLIHRNVGGSGLLEMQPHNLIHGFVGGVMSQFFSPRDPVFWLHHANIDRLWAAWLTNPGHQNPTDADWLGFTHHFRNAQGNRVGFTSQDLLDEQQLGYTYESLTEGVGLKPPERLVAVLAADADPPPETVVATTGPTGLGAESVTVPLSPEPTARASALPEAASPETPSRAILIIDEVRADTPPGTNYRVYVGARPDHAEDLDPEGPYFIGHLHFFGAVGGNAHHHEHGGSGLSFKFDITDQLTELRRLGRWDGEGIPPVVVTPAPLGPPPDTGLEARTRTVMPTVPPNSHPRIGSVSLITTDPRHGPCRDARGHETPTHRDTDPACTSQHGAGRVRENAEPTRLLCLWVETSYTSPTAREPRAFRAPGHLISGALRTAQVPSAPVIPVAGSAGGHAVCPAVALPGPPYARRPSSPPPRHHLVHARGLHRSVRDHFHRECVSQHCPSAVVLIPARRSPGKMLLKSNLNERL